MINKLILKELDKLQDAEIKSYDDLKHIYHIGLKETVKFEVNHQYIIELSKELITPNNLFASNWNNGSFPTCRYLKCHVSKIFTDKIFIYCVYYNIEDNKELEDEWQGWLPTNEINIIKEVIYG